MLLLDSHIQRMDTSAASVNYLGIRSSDSFSAKTAADRDLIQCQIDATDRSINALAYELYGLTAEEIKTVEGQDR